MTIKSLALTNWQCHRAETIQLDKHLTVLCGESDRGKTSFLRALRFLCLNKPRGDSFITHGEKSTTVSVTVDGKQINRTKGSENTYHLDDKRFAAFGNDVPPEIASLLNLTEDNFQGQHSSPYWLFETPGQLSKELNRIVNLESIDNALAHAAAGLRTARATVDSTTARLTQAREAVGALAWVPALHRNLCTAEEAYGKVVQVQQKRARIACIVQDATILREQQANAAQRKAAGFAALSAAGRLREIQGRKGTVQRLLEEIVIHRNTVQAYTVQANKSQADLDRKLAGTRCPVCQQKVTVQ